ncbi:putative ubiquitin-conjugating enzyme/RWD [Helianthus anomalus]
MQENIFEWQFAIRGPNDTKFEGGIYHGRICLSRGANEPSYSRATRELLELGSKKRSNEPSLIELELELEPEPKNKLV